MGRERLLRFRAAGAVVVLMALAGCARPAATSPSSPAPSSSPTPQHASSACSDGRPSAACAGEVATHLGFPVLWMPVPEGWGVRQGLLVRPGSSTASEDVANGGLDVGMVSRDTGVQPPGMHPAGTTVWRGSQVALWSGTPDPSSYPAGYPTPAWMVSARWTYHGQRYSVGVLANPELGPTGSRQDGMTLLLRVLRRGVRYANP